MLIKLPSPLHHKMYQENKKITSASTKKAPGTILPVDFVVP